MAWFIAYSSSNIGSVEGGGWVGKVEIFCPVRNPTPACQTSPIEGGRVHRPSPSYEGRTYRRRKSTIKRFMIRIVSFFSLLACSTYARSQIGQALSRVCLKPRI